MDDMQEPLSPLASLPGSPSTSRSEPKTRKRRTAKAEAEGRKRGRYVSRACEVCKRRKLKCDGQEPCQRCVERSDECSYLDASVGTNQIEGETEAKEVAGPRGRRSSSRDLKHLTNLIINMQQKIDSLNARIDKPPRQATSVSQEVPRSIHAYDGNPSPAPSSENRSRLGIGKDGLSLLDVGSPPLRAFSGPTSSNFSFDVAKNLLQRVQAPDGSAHSNISPTDSQDIDDDRATKEDLAFKAGFRESLELLQSIGEEEAVRLAQVYEDVLGVLHPIIDFKILYDHIRDIYRILEAGPVLNLGSSVGEANLNILVLILAIALLSEGGVNRHLSAKLFSSVRYALDYRIHANNIDISGQVLMLLAGVYHFFRDEHRLASRIVAITARMTMEAGLHRREVLLRTFTTRKDRVKAVIVLWSIFVFDRQFSFAAGLPDSMKDNIMDVPEVEGAPYLLAMTEYVQIGEKAWNSVTDRHGRVTSVCSKDTHDFLEYQLQQWQNSFPEQLQPPPHRVGDTDNSESHGVRCMRVLLYLRANQMRILILRPLLFSQTSFAANKERVARVLEVARDTIRVLAHLDATSDIYRKQQVIFNHFLASALAVLSLVLAHEPQERQQQIDYLSEGDSALSMFASAREEIILALELVKSYSSFSSSSRRLWRTFSTLKELLSRLGLLKRDKKKIQDSFTDPEMEFSELFQLLGEGVQEFPADPSPASQERPASGIGLPMTTTWQTPQSLDFQEQWGDLNTMAGLSNVFGEEYQDYSWTFHGFL